ncbi:ATP-binding protein [Nocardioides sp.]|uniref:ATP-binding protein n=1 Tax=Nocardioides sp. TaxID=35761 RepID=UPI002733279C|nr:ATP-binding protein [Nocardioides sp.]MDP3893690.1 ATP-binding protein [Nocardioides sp.]
MRTLADRLAAAGRRREQSTPGWPAAAELTAALAVLRAEHGLDDESGLEEEPGAPGSLPAVAEVFGLDATDTELLWCVAAPELDHTVGIAYRLLGGTQVGSAPTIALALELAGVPTAGPQPFWRLGSDGPLRRHRLLSVDDAAPWLSRGLRVPDPVLAGLAGALPADPPVDRLRTELVAMDVEGVDEVARSLSGGAPLVWVRSAAGMSGTAVAAGALQLLGLHWLAVDLRRHPAGDDLTDLLAYAARDAGLRGWALVVVGGEVLAEGPRPGTFEALEDAAVPVVVVSAKPWNPAWLPRLPVVVDAGPLSVDDRSRAWREALGEVAQDPELLATLAGLRLTAESIGEAARHARALAVARAEPLGPSLVREAARRVGGSGGVGADRMGGPVGRRPPSFADLVLPGHVADSLQRLTRWGRYRDVVGAEGMLQGRGRGIAALFTGNPGTGKTLAAHVIAEELSIELYQVELSSIVDKYIGETEKNLERVFAAAEALDVILFFDEADALFGSRSSVQDSRDRYANQEVAYLLQRMESFDGITILSTNLRGNLDKAFSRRMSFIVHFPDPDEATRARLWHQHLSKLPRLDEEDRVDVDYLARTAELTGGDIRNIVLAAAYEAAAEGTGIGHRHVVAAAVREYHKLGRFVPDQGFAVARPLMSRGTPEDR